MNPSDKRRAVVAINFGDRDETADVKIDQSNPDVDISAPFEEDRKGTLPLHLSIPPQRCVVIVTT